jgi:VanZ family protein
MPIKKLLERSALPIAIILTIFIAIISLVSLKGGPHIKISNSDKLGHFIAYLLLSLSWLYALKNYPLKKNKKYLFISLLIGYGIIIEVLQGVLTTYRQADLYDIIANSAGVLFAVILYRKIK